MSTRSGKGRTDEHSKEPSSALLLGRRMTRRGCRRRSSGPASTSAETVEALVAKVGREGAGPGRGEPADRAAEGPGCPGQAAGRRAGGARHDGRRPTRPPGRGSRSTAQGRHVRRQVADKTAGPLQQAASLARLGRRAGQPQAAASRRASRRSRPSRSSRPRATPPPPPGSAARRCSRRSARSARACVAWLLLPALEAARVKLLNKAIGLLVGILGGMLARSVFKRIWQAVTGEDEAPNGHRRPPRLAGDPARGGASGRHLRRRAGRPRPRHGRGHRQAHRRVARRDEAGGQSTRRGEGSHG